MSAPLACITTKIYAYMRKVILLSTTFLLLLSCSDNSKKASSLQYEDEVVDTVNEEIVEDTVPNMILPSGYSQKGYPEYVPQNDLERRLLADLKEMEKATNKLDYKKIVSLYYPDYFKYLQKQVPDKTLPEIKEKFKEYLASNLSERNNNYTNLWPEAKYSGIIVTNIINRVKEGDGLLYLYEYHTILYSETDTIYKKEGEFSIAASQNNGKKWYSTANSIEENFEILGISFSRKAIDEVLTKK